MSESSVLAHIKPPHNFIIDFYLNSFQKRLLNTESHKNLLIGFILKFCYILIISKYCLSLVIDFDYEIKLYLYDLSVILGGIPKYNTIYFLFVCILGLFLNIKFQLSCDQNFWELLQIFDEINGLNRINIFYPFSNDINQRKLTSFTKMAYKFMNISVVVLSKLHDGPKKSLLTQTCSFTFQ